MSGQPDQPESKFHPSRLDDLDRFPEGPEQKNLIQHTTTTGVRGHEHTVIPADLYLEAHVTISPVFDKDRAAVERIAELHGFKLAHLIMLKVQGADEPSKRDTFMTGHDKNIDILTFRTMRVTQELRAAGFKVWRYKIESCVIDSRQQNDVWGVLDPDRPELPLIACDGCSR